MTDIRNQAQTILNQAVPEAKIIRSNENPPAYANDFLRYTNTSHAVLMANWLTGGYQTACNGFVNWYAQQLGIQGISEWFTLKDSLHAVNKGYAWVAATGKAPRPKCGDILKHKITHVDVALDFKGSILRRVAAGQGDGSYQSMHPRPRAATEVMQEYDVLRRVDGQGPYNWANLEGWLDLDLYFGPATQGLVPDWLVGWWQMTWRGQLYYYYFDRNCGVQWTHMKPSTNIWAPLVPSDNGTFAVEGLGVTVQWNTSGSVEVFRPVLGSNNTNMWGIWNKLETITGEKM